MKGIKHIRRDFHSVAWVMPQGWDYRGYRGLGVKNIFFPKFNRIWCVSYSHEWHIFPASWGPGEGPNGQISLNFNITKSISNIFKPNFVCLLTNEIHKTYQTGFSFRRLGHAPGVGLAK